MCQVLCLLYKCIQQILCVLLCQLFVSDVILKRIIKLFSRFIFRQTWVTQTLEDNSSYSQYEVSLEIEWGQVFQFHTGSLGISYKCLPWHSLPMSGSELLVYICGFISIFRLISNRLSEHWHLDHGVSQNKVWPK